MSTTSNKTKYLSVVTYCIALVCILIGLFFPLGDLSDWSNDNLLFMMLPQALGIVLGTFGVEVDWSNVGSGFTRGFLFDGTNANHMAFAVVLLAIIAVLGIIMLIPVFASKSDSRVAAGCAYTVEILAVIVLSYYTLMSVYCHEIYPIDWSLTGIALGGTALMLIIQSIGNKGGSGVMKLIMTIFGAAGVFALFNVPALLGTSESVEIGGSIAVLYADGVSGLDTIYLFISGLFAEGYSYNFLTEFLAVGSGTLAQATSCVLFVTAALVLLNFVIDVVCLGANSGKGSLAFDIIRYVLEVVLALVSVILIFVMDVDGFKPGLLMYAILVVAVIQVIISSVRCAVYRQPEESAEYAAATLPEGSYYDDTAPVVPVYQPTYEAAPAAAPAPAPAPAPVYVYVPASAPAPAPAPAPTYVYAPSPAPAPAAGTAGYYAPPASANVIYRGPTDSFISRLTEPEKVEFAKLFIEKINGPYANIPDYVVGGDNKEFFVSLFIYLGRFRSMISDGLMNKIYNELNLLS